MDESHPIVAVIRKYEELLRNSPEHPDRRTIEMLIAQAREKLREQADVGLPSLQPKVEDAANATLDEDAAEAMAMANDETLSGGPPQCFRQRAGAYRCGY